MKAMDVWPTLFGFMAIGIGLGMALNNLELFTILGIIAGIISIYIIQNKVNK